MCCRLRLALQLLSGCRHYRMYWRLLLLLLLLLRS
jgi:hypothetical protein